VMMISPSAVHSTKQSSYCWQKATNSSSVMGTRHGFKITGAIDSKSSTTNCMHPVYCHVPSNPRFDLGTYEILAPIGAGGIGEAYKARDTRLNENSWQWR